MQKQRSWCIWYSFWCSGKNGSRSYSSKSSRRPARLTRSRKVRNGCWSLLHLLCCNQVRKTENGCDMLLFVDARWGCCRLQSGYNQDVSVLLDWSPRGVEGRVRVYIVKSGSKSESELPKIQRIFKHGYDTIKPNGKEMTSPEAGVRRCLEGCVWVVWGTGWIPSTVSAVSPRWRSFPTRPPSSLSYIP